MRFGPHAILYSLAFAGLGTPAHLHAQELNPDNSGKPFTQRMPDEYRGLWAHDWSRCDSESGYPVDGIFVGRVSFGSWKGGEKQPGEGMLEQVEFRESGTIAIKLSGVDERQILTLHGDGRLTIVWGAQGPFKFTRCDAG